MVLAQPHRQGDRDQRRTDVVWRLIVSGRVKHNDVSNNDLWRAFDLYLRAKRALSGPEASKRPFAVIDGGGASFWDADPAANTEEWEAMRDARDLVKARFASAGRALRDCGAMVEKAVDAMTDAHPDMDERVVAFWIAHALPTGLAALAKHFGLVK
ncbi:MAG TPA: hypothetical protein VGU45_01565 [Microvirga sp.]|nr:hypothetical protein [Microvirga sp.]